MEKSNKRGKIPQTDWPLIMARYEGGETLSSIARTYDCSPPAISYIISRHRKHPPQPDAAPTPPSPELPHLVKAHSGTPLEAPAAAPAHAPAAVEAIRPAVNGHGDGRGKLHLAFGSGSQPSGGRAAAAPPLAVPSGLTAPAANGAAERHGTEDRSPPPPPVLHTAPNGHDWRLNERPAQQPREPEGPRKDSGTFIDKELRNRVDGDITAFLAAFDAALAEDSPASRFSLREATDRLLRAGARTRIELERLEARVPLPVREAGAPPDGWRR